MIYMLSFITILVITPAVRTTASEKGFTDDADGDPLKIHRHLVALLGRLVIAVAV